MTTQTVAEAAHPRELPPIAPEAAPPIVAPAVVCMEEDLPLIAARRQAAATKPLPPAVRFASPTHRARTVRDAERARAIVLFVPCTQPGRLAAAIDADMEAVLASRGAHPSSLGDGATPREVVEDQIHRAVALPVRGVCVCLPRLAPIADKGILHDDDARALSAWMEVARAERRLRVVVLLDEEDKGISVRVPTTLEAILSNEPSPARARPRATEAAYDEPSPAPPEAAVLPDLAVPDKGDEAAKRVSSPARTSAVADTLRPPPGAPSFEAELELDTLLRRASEPQAEAQVVVDEPADDEAAFLAACKEDAARLEAERQSRIHAERLAVERLEAQRVERERAEAQRLEAERVEAERAQRLIDAATWRSYAVELDAARGPKPVATIEKLFAQRYVPLLGAVARNEADAAVENVVDEWRESFRESYEASFGSVKVTAKRPPMVMDAPEIAQRVARLASARNVKLILVDAMGFDLSERVGVRIGRRLDKRAILVEKSVLWSALPSTTPVQMHLLARGAEGLKDIPPPASEPEIPRGRTVATLRRERMANREILKLDVVEARLRQPGGSYDERLDAIADEVAEILVKTMETFPARTLAYVFGDHGFMLGRGANGWATGPATQGGATPEEVLVAGQGWLVDAVQ